MLFTLAYDRTTSVHTSLNGSQVAFAANTRRAPVSFSGVLREPVLMRRLMTALHEVILGDFREGFRGFVLDPVITVHPDEVCFEAFSTDQSAYVRLAAATDAFEITNEPTYGTTNIDFTFALRNSLEALRSSRRTTFNVGGGGFGVQTQVGAAGKAHFEHKVELPESWVKGFLQVQSALAMRPFTFEVRPADLLSAICYFMENNARKPPRGMRFEFKTNQAIALVLEPWDERFWLTGTGYAGYDRVVRLWGRKRLELLRDVLPFADKVTVGVLGRSLPHFYICHIGDFTFTLVLSGWVRNDWSSSSALDLLAPQADLDAEQIAAVYNFLNSRYTATRAEVEAHTLLGAAEAEAALFRLCREGRAMYDPAKRRYRSRELFGEPLDWETFFAPDPRLSRARALVKSGAVEVQSHGPSEVRKGETRVYVSVNDGNATYNVIIAVDRESRLRYAECECAFFKEHIMALGPCEHILAARAAAGDQGLV
ncbi:MAG: hypothetical protein DYG88_04700 [Chloroflexi bacterium CFX4]|nr:hypothetical protein [Chloroflexi bacterium CFX4]MDL1924124.1 hypothetical protein [Chloroflexi bacterium CFX3]